ncbi:MAG: hypothetical protein AAGA03_18190, partial [Planctomycetota bacterium]
MRNLPFNSPLATWVFAAAAFLPTFTSAQNAEEGEVDAKAEIAVLKVAFARTLQSLSMEGGDSNASRVQLLDRSVLSWSNPERATSSGALHLWVRDGRPQAAMCLYPQGPEGEAVTCECQSLSQESIAMSYNGQVVWNPAESDMEFRSIGDELSSPPRPNANARLLQMRTLARRFTAKVVPNNGSPKPLRCLTAPIYRYRFSSPDVEVVDAAIFAFVQGTDPEILLTIEALQK